MPGLGDVLVFYAPPLVIARLLRHFAADEPLTAAALAPYVLTFAGLWLTGEIIWRVAVVLLARAEIRGMEALYIEAMDELLAKDLAFFHDNFAGSLTKRALGYARRFEDVFDVMSFQVIANAIPLAFVSVVLWSYSPLLIIALLGMLAADVRDDLSAHPAAAPARGHPRGRVQPAGWTRRRFDRQRRSGARVCPRKPTRRRFTRATSATSARRRSSRGTTRTFASIR